MTGFIKSIFLLVGMLVFSIILWIIMFADVNREYFWSNLEPVYQSIWMDNTLDDGEKVDVVMTQIFDRSVEVHE